MFGFLPPKFVASWRRQLQDLGARSSARKLLAGFRPTGISHNASILLNITLVSSEDLYPVPAFEIFCALGLFADFPIMEHPDSIRNDTDSKTLSRLVMVRTKDPELVILLNAIQTACKLISRSVRKAGIAGLCKIR